MRDFVILNILFNKVGDDKIFEKISEALIQIIFYFKYHINFIVILIFYYDY